MKLIIMQSSPATSSLLGPNILLNTLFSDTLNLCSFLSVTKFHTHTKKKGKIMVLYILIFMFVVRPDKRQNILT